jgi:lipoate---protein ligase
MDETMEWRIIPLEVHDAYTNMGIDEALMESVIEGRSDPVIRFYRWKPSAVSIGTFQSMEKEVNITRCNELEVNYVRRITGGGAVYHDFSGEVTYSVIAPLSLFPQGIRESYQFICDWIIFGLGLMGIPASFVPINDIIVEGKKISGNAQTRKRGALLQHGTVLYDIDFKSMFSVLSISKEKISDKDIKAVEDRVTSVSRYSNKGIDGLYEALFEGFTRGKKFRIDSISEAESKRAKELADSVYSTKEWNFSR